MIALTARLNERDDTIIQLQSEMDALERINKDQETDIFQKQERMTILEKQMREAGLNIPEEDEASKQLHVLDNGRRYLPYTQSGMMPEDLLLNGDDEIKFDFLTADEKVDELQMILQK